MSDDRRFDPQVLVTLERKVGPEALARITGLFREHLPRRRAAFAEGLAAGNLAACAEALHSIKGSALTLGLSCLARRTESMERLAGEGAAEGLAQHVAGFDVECREALDHLRRRPAGTGS